MHLFIRYLLAASWRLQFGHSIRGIVFRHGRPKTKEQVSDKTAGVHKVPHPGKDQSFWERNQSGKERRRREKERKGNKGGKTKLKKKGCKA